VRGPIEGDLDATGLHIGVAAASWNQAITDKLVDGALARLADLGAAEVTLLRVPGALELPLAAQRLTDSGCDAVVAIGAVVKGDTDHYEVVVRESSRGIGDVALATGIPVANAILAVHRYGDALERAGVGEANKGFEAVNAAVATANALKQLGAS
jgi:6,7-dimethyl-8-ribityllumazine synthase